MMFPGSAAPPAAPRLRLKGGTMRDASMRARYSLRWLLIWEPAQLTAPERRFALEVLTSRGTLNPRTLTRIEAMRARVRVGSA